MLFCLTLRNKNVIKFTEQTIEIATQYITGQEQEQDKKERKKAIANVTTCSEESILL